MEGLWTIRWQPFTASSPGGYKVGGSEPWPGEDPTPVVPCDDAAVERVAIRLHHLDLEVHRPWVREMDTTKDAWRMVAREALGAAGEA